MKLSESQHRLTAAITATLGLGLLSACSSGGSDDGATASLDDDVTVVQSTPTIATDTESEDITETGTEEETETETTTLPTIEPLLVYVGSDENTVTNPILSLNPAGPGGSPNQSLRAGDVISGSDYGDLLVGGLGIDVLLGGYGDDVLIGGTEDFNNSVDGDDRGSDNRDRALGQEGDDVFIWAPGDGSDFFDGGDGIDTIIFGVLGETRDSDGSTDGAPFFNVNPPNRDGSQDFDGIFLQPETNLPITRVSASPGFCSVLDASTNAAELDALGLDQVIRFSLRGIANDFDAGIRTDDDGLRVAVSVRNVEFLVCTRRDLVEGAGTDNIEVIDLRSPIAVPGSIDDLPALVQAQIE